MINFKEEALKYQDEILADLFELLKVESYTGGEVSEEAPFGKGPRAGLDKMLSFGKRDGYITKNVGNVSGHIEVGKGDEIFGILGHVDVVPANPSEWISRPFEPEIRDGKIFARGVLDDKGPTIAGYYAVKLLDKIGVDWKKRVRVIIGTDEEVGFRCVERYFQTEDRPDLGFTPDAHYPVIYGEKAQANFRYTLKFVEDDSLSEYKLLSFEAGLAKNMVPSEAIAKLTGDFIKLEEKLNEYSYSNYKLEKDDVITLTFYGKAAHGSTPNLGTNAATILAEFLDTLSLDKNAKNYVNHIAINLANDPFGEKLSLKYSDDEMGTATYNYGIFKYSLENKEAIVEADSRYPAKFDLESKVHALAFDNFDIDLYSKKSAHYVPKTDPLVQTLLSVYRKHTGDFENDAMVIGGGTYARCMKKAVAFGVLLPGREDTMHQANEYMFLEDLILSVAIFAESIYEICCK